MDFDPNESIDLAQLFAMVQRWAWLFLVGILLGAAGAYFYSRTQTPVYEATTNILVTRNSQQTVGDLTQSMNLTQLVETYVRMLSMDEFLGIVSQRVNYPVQAENVDVSALTNTQIIELRVQDIDPARAAQIADTMVAVLVEQNESLQASRYGDAEKNLDLQITEAEAKISGIQSQLDTAKDDALVQQVAEAKANIDATVEVINGTLAELERLKQLSWESARFQLNSTQASLTQLQVLLDQQVARQADLQAKLASAPAEPQTDPNSAASIQAQLTTLEVNLTDTRQKIEAAQKELGFLSTLDTSAGFAKTLIEKQNFLKTQQSLLASYQGVYTNLLSTEEVKRTTNEIDNLEKNLALYQQIYLNLLKSREEVKTQRMQNTPTVEQVSPASSSREPVKPRMLLNILLGGLAGLVLSGSIVVLREATDQTLKGKEEVESLLNTKVIGYVINIAGEEKAEGIYVTRAPRSPVAEAFRSLRSNLEFSGKEQPIKSLLVTSCGPSEGKTTIAANLAASLAHMGKTVILVDADLRRPRVHRYAGLTNILGLSELLTAPDSAELSSYLQQLEEVSGLDVLPSGGLPPNPSELLSSEKMRQLIQRLAASYDYVILDAPPIVVADPQVLSGLVDGVLLVMVPGKTRKDVTYAIQEQMEHSGARLVGVVFNRLQHRRRSGYGGYSYYYYPYYNSSDYYYPHGSAAGGKKSKKHSAEQRNDPVQPDSDSGKGPSAG